MDRYCFYKFKISKNAAVTNDGNDLSKDRHYYLYKFEDSEEVFFSSLSFYKKDDTWKRKKLSYSGNIVIDYDNKIIVLKSKELIVINNIEKVNFFEYFEKVCGCQVSCNIKVLNTKDFLNGLITIETSIEDYLNTNVFPNKKFLKIRYFDIKDIIKRKNI